LLSVPRFVLGGCGLALGRRAARGLRSFLSEIGEVCDPDHSARREAHRNKRGRPDCISLFKSRWANSMPKPDDYNPPPAPASGYAADSRRSDQASCYAGNRDFVCCVTSICLTAGRDETGASMPKPLIVCSGTSLRTFREWTASATEALRLVRAHVKLRRPGVRVEDERGSPLSFFQLKDLADSEAMKDKASRV
jgi:hypothetical protein